MMSPICRRIEIVNALGLHLRAADQFVRLARQFQADLLVHFDGQSVDGKSILELTTLAAGCGTRLGLEAIGTDAETLIAALSELIEAGFGETDESGV